ncbi:MAG: permease-like cell division protein FtsX [Thermoanaerobaculia bacterium]
MTLAKALAYFLREALQNLGRSWRVSLLAVATIAVSLFVGGAFLLASGNFGGLVEHWRQERKVVVYLEPGAAPEAAEALRAELEGLPFVRAAQLVSAGEARSRFLQLFPSLESLVDQPGSVGLPASVELSLRPAGSGGREPPAGWAAQLEARPGVDLVDDDRDWVSQLTAVLAVGRALGLCLGLVLLAGAVFTIASVVRLTAYLYADEIAIMRLVGATEFFIRGPFYAEGLLQGLFGGLLATGALAAAFELAKARVASTLWGSMLLGRFLSPLELAGLVAFGTLAGLAGAVISLRRERLGAAEEG